MLVVPAYYNNNNEGSLVPEVVCVHPETGWSPGQGGWLWFFDRSVLLSCFFSCIFLSFLLPPLSVTSAGVHGQHVAAGVEKFMKGGSDDAILVFPVLAHPPPPPLPTALPHARPSEKPKQNFKTGSGGGGD